MWCWGTPSRNQQVLHSFTQETAGVMEPRPPTGPMCGGGAGPQGELAAQKEFWVAHVTKATTGPLCPQDS